MNVDTVYRTVGTSTTTAGGRAGAFEARADGGPLAAGQPAIVGERGPEVFVPQTAGTVIPNGALGNSVTVNVNHPNTYGLDSDLQIGFSTAAVLLGIEAGAVL